MKRRLFNRLATGAAALIVTGGTFTLCGCGDTGGSQETKRDLPPTETMKDSMKYMQDQYAKKGGSKKKAR